MKKNYEKLFYFLKYLKINWQNIIAVKNKIPEIEVFNKMVGEVLQN